MGTKKKQVGQLREYVEEFIVTKIIPCEANLSIYARYKLPADQWKFKQRIRAWAWGDLISLNLITGERSKTGISMMRPIVDSYDFEADGTEIWLGHAEVFDIDNDKNLISAKIVNNRGK